MLQLLFILVAIVTAAAIILLIVFRALGIKSVIVYEYHQALKYSKGHYVGVLGPGKYWISANSSIYAVDIRPEFITVSSCPGSWSSWCSA